MPNVRSGRHESSSVLVSNHVKPLIASLGLQLVIARNENKVAAATCQVFHAHCIEKIKTGQTCSSVMNSNEKTQRDECAGWLLTNAVRQSLVKVVDGTRRHFADGVLVEAIF